MLKQYLKSAKTKRSRRKAAKQIVSFLSAVVVFITTYALVLPAISMDLETAATEPGVEIVQPAAEPIAAEPIAAEPVAAEPIAAEPIAAEPVAAEHAPAEPIAAEIVPAESTPQESSVQPTEGAAAPAVEENVVEIADGSIPMAAPDAAADSSQKTEVSNQDPEVIENGVSDSADNTNAENTGSETAGENIASGPFIYDTDEYIVTVFFGPEAQIPAETTLTWREFAAGSAEYNIYYPIVGQKLAEEGVPAGSLDEAISAVRFFALNFTDVNGIDIRPAAPVDVLVEYKMPTNLVGNEKLYGVTFRADEGQPARATLLELNARDNSVCVEAADGVIRKLCIEDLAANDPHTNMVIAQLELIPDAEAGQPVVEEQSEESTAEEEILTTQYLTADGEAYNITLTCGPESCIPEGAGLAVSEIVEASDTYEEYISKTEDALDPAEKVVFARFFDIKIMKDGAEIQPNGAVNVKIELADALTEDIKVVHFEHNDAVDPAENIDTPVVLDSERVEAETLGNAVGFETESFSVFGIVGTTIEKTVLASDGQNYRISVTYGADANLPDDVNLKVEELEQGGEDYNRYLETSASKLGKEADDITYARIFDISLVSITDPDLHYQPEADVSVSVELINADDNTVENLKVLHISNDIVDVLETSVDGNALHFMTGSFSIYPIVSDDEENARIGYRFWYNDGTQNVLLSTQYFRYKDVHPANGDPLTINEPSIPGIENATWNRIFRGWSTTPSFNDSDSNLKTVETLNAELTEKVRGDFTEGTLIDVYANLKDVYYVTYVDINPNNILATEIVPLAESGSTTFTVKPASQLRPTIDADTVLEGWYDINNPETVYEPGQENVTINANLTLYPKVEGGSWLIFDDNDPVWNEEKQEYVSGGASFTPPAFYLDAVTERPADPTWAGYTFGGWYTDKDCTTQFEFGNTLDHDTTVFAKWIPSDSQYRVVYWKQRTTDAWDASDEDKTYDYADSRLVTEGVVTGQIVNLDVSDTRVYGAGGSSGEADQEYFTYNAGKTDQSIVVKADGTSVINVYYDRQVITINFTGNLYHYEETTDTTGELYALVNGEYVRVYPDGNGGYETRTTETRTESVLHYYNGERYNITTGNTGEQWGINGNQVVRVYRHYRNGFLGFDHWSTKQEHSLLNDQQYNGTRYIVNNNGTYGFVDGSMIELDSSGNYTTTETVTETISTPYTGTVYKRVTQNGLTLKGLYGRSMYPGEWPTSLNGNTERWWRFANNNGGNTTLNAPWNSYRISPAASNEQINNRTWNLTGNNKSTGQTIFYYGEDINGNYTVLLAETERASNSLTVNSEKFYGYHTSYWTYGPNGTRNELNGGATSISTSYYSTSTPLYIYYARDKFPLTFYSNNASNKVDVIEDVPYEKSLEEYAAHSEGQKNGYYFLGWYADPSCTEPFDFSQTMPHNNVAVYGKWQLERFRIVVEPGANNVYMGSQATRFRLDYDETIDGGLLESATRAGYILDGWYTDPDFTNRFLFTSPVNASTPGVDMTYQTSPTWAAARAAYGDDDEDHENVRGILHLYAKWIPDTNSTGINVVYDAGEAGLYDSLGAPLTTVPIDTHMYGLNGTTTAREAPSNYNDLYSFKYWEATREIVGEGGEVTTETVTIYPGDPVNLSDLVFTDPIYDENGDLLRKTVTLRAVYDLIGDPARITHITYDGDTISYMKYGTSETQELHGKTRDGTNQITVTLNEEVNQTIVLPDEDDFYLDGYKLVGWSFFEGNLDEQAAALAAYNANNPDNPLTDFACGQEVATDNLDQGTVNDHTNILYAKWEPKTYTVTVKQVVENGVPENSFAYSYKTGEERLIADQTETVKTLTGNSSFEEEELEYYDRTGDVIRIVTPAIPDDAAYSVRVNAIVTKDDGTTEILNPTALGDYQILGDVVITYTYSLNVLVKLCKRDAVNHDTVLTNAVFTVTPVEFNSTTQHWENAGSGQSLTVDSATLEKYLQEGTYRIEETSAPAQYAKIESNLYLTIRKDEPFTLFAENGSDISSSVAELDAAGKILTVYDNPIRTVTLSKTVVPQEEGSFSFKATVFKNDGSRLGNYVIGNADGTDLTTNNIGEATLSLAHGGSLALKIPHGCRLTVEEAENTEFEASYIWNNGDAVTSRLFESASEGITADSTLSYTNKRNKKPVAIYKTGLGENETITTGAAFEVYKASDYDDAARKPKAGAVAVAQGITNENGILDLGQLLIETGDEYTEYRLVETSAPAGYILPDYLMKIFVYPDRVTGMQGTDNMQIKDAEDYSDITDKSTTVLRIWNNPGVSLPSTGGPGTTRLYLLGVLLTGIAGTGFVLRRRRRTN